MNHLIKKKNTMRVSFSHLFYSHWSLTAQMTPPLLCIMCIRVVWFLSRVQLCCHITVFQKHSIVFCDFLFPLWFVCFYSVFLFAGIFLNYFLWDFSPNRNFTHLYNTLKCFILFIFFIQSQHYRLLEVLYHTPSHCLWPLFDFPFPCFWCVSPLLLLSSHILCSLPSL